MYPILRTTLGGVMSDSPEKDLSSAHLVDMMSALFTQEPPQLNHQSCLPKILLATAIVKRKSGSVQDVSTPGRVESIQPMTTLESTFHALKR